MKWHYSDNFFVLWMALLLLLFLSTLWVEWHRRPVNWGNCAITREYDETYPTTGEVSHVTISHCAPTGVDPTNHKHIIMTTPDAGEITRP